MRKLERSSNGIDLTRAWAEVLIDILLGVFKSRYTLRTERDWIEYSPVVPQSSLIRHAFFDHCGPAGGPIDALLTRSAR